MPPDASISHSLRGSRVLLRQWRADDLDRFAAMNADAEVMEFFPATLSREESVARLEFLREAIAAQGWGQWAVEADGQLAGMTGLSRPMFEAAFTPCVEIGWRFRKEYWGKGYALEAARLALGYAFGVLQLPEVLSWTAVVNVRSERLMQRLGMERHPLREFEHPKLELGHPLRRHVLYRILKERWSHDRSGDLK